MKKITTVTGSIYFYNEEHKTFGRAEKGCENHTLSFYEIEGLRTDVLEVGGRFVGSYKVGDETRSIISTEIVSIEDLSAPKSIAEKMRESMEDARDRAMASHPSSFIDNSGSISPADLAEGNKNSSK